MKTTSLLSRAALAALLCVGGVAPSGQAQLIISTIAEWQGQGSPDTPLINSTLGGQWGPYPDYTPTFGQTFTLNDPANNVLTAVHFRISYAVEQNFNYRAYLYEWDGDNVIAPSLWTSDPAGIGVGNDQDISASTGGIALTIGQQYIVFLSTLGEAGTVTYGATWGYLASGSSTPEAGGFYYSSADSSAGWTDNVNWNPYTETPLPDLAFELQFVPEPGMSGLVAALGLLGFGWIRRFW